MQILVNKADRLKPDDLVEGDATVAESLEETGLRSWAAPLALSARLALQGKLGDADALAKSGWDEVAAAPRRADRRPQRRAEGARPPSSRGGASSAMLLERAREQAAEERARIDAARARAQELALRAAKLEREADEAAQVVAGALGGAAADWKRDLDVVVTGRDAAAGRERSRAHSAIASIAAITRLAQPLARVLVDRRRQPTPAARPTTTSRPIVHAAVRTFAASGGRADALVPLTRSAIASLVEHLLELAAAVPSADGPRGGSPSSKRSARRLRRARRQGKLSP